MAFNYDHGVFDFGFTKISLIEPDQLVSSEQLEELSSPLSELRDAYFDALVLMFLSLAKKIIKDEIYNKDRTINVDLNKLYPPAHNIDSFYDSKIKLSFDGKITYYSTEESHAFSIIEHMFKHVTNATDLVEKFKAILQAGGQLTKSNVIRLLNNHVSEMRVRYGFVDPDITDDFNDLIRIGSDVNRYRTATNNIHIKDLLRDKPGSTVTFDYLRDADNDNTPITSIRYLKVEESDLSSSLTSHECHEDDCLDSNLALVTGVTDEKFESFSTELMSHAWYANRLNYELSHLVIDSVKCAQAMKI